MKEFYSKQAMTTLFLTLLMAVLGLPSTVVAQTTVNFRDDFNYPPGNLYEQGAWVTNGIKTANPIQVISTALTYAGYYEDANGKSVRLGSDKSSENLHARITDEEEGIKSGNVYYSALINVSEQPTKDAFVMSLEIRTKTKAVSDKMSGTELGRLYIGKGDNADEVKIGVERGSTKPVYSSSPIKLGQTYLVVVRYEINAASPGSDNVYLYVNPSSFTSEPKTASAIVDGVKATGTGVMSQGLQGFILRQASTATVTAPVLNVASVRVASTYAGLFGNQEESKTPTLKASKKSIVCGEVYTGDEYNETITITGANLTGDITVESSSPAVTVTPATIAAADAMSADGAKLNIKVVYTDGEQNATITVKSPGADDAKVSLSWTGYTIPEVTTIKKLYGENPDDGLTYRYTGEAVVTFVDNSSGKPVYYLQDATGAIPVGDDYEILTESYKAGDKLTGMIFGLQETFGTLSAISFNKNLGKVLSDGNTVEPAEVTLSQLKAAPADYVSQLVKIKGLTFKDVAEGATFKEGMAQPVVTDGSEEAKVRIFKNTTLIGTAIPTGSVTITGLFTSAKQLIIAPRGADDIVEASASEPSFEVTPAKVSMGSGIVGKPSTVAVIHVSAKNMPAPILLELTGAGSSQFDLSTSKIDMGSSETDVTVTYTPTTVAVHRAFLSIDCPSLPELSQSIAISAYAIDEQNPPTATVTPQTLGKFSAKVGEKHEQKISVSSTGMPDYVYVKMRETGPFHIYPSMLMKNVKNTITVTFEPTAAGSFSNDIVISALGMDDIVVPVEGVATDGTQTDPTREGDDFVLNTDSPLTLLNETFDGLDRNKPFHINGWTNSAITGPRAWWGYTFLDTDESAGEHVAKVTAYDSKVSDDFAEPAQMLLVTPALDFKNSASKMFTFRVRGDYLLDNQTDKLELCYIDIEDGDPYIAPVEGFTMPCTKDESGEWYEYHIDLTGNNIADKFFMGFRFTSTRGHENAATYYIDDVTYGRTDIPAITTDVAQLAFTAQPGNDATSDMVTVSGNNLTEPIDLTLGGPNKSKFKLSTTTIGFLGGTFNVAFNSFDEGVHEAYVKLSSRGAADKYVVLSVNNTTATGITSIPATTAHVSVYDLAGNLVAEKTLATPAETVAGLAAGVYVVKATTNDSIRTYKVRLK